MRGERSIGEGKGAERSGRDARVVYGKAVGWLVVLRLNVPVNNFLVISGRSHRFLGN